MLGVSVYAGIIAYIELNYLNLADRVYIQNVGMMHSVLGFVISLLLVFRTNTAYDRWWEGRKVWGGMTNTCRNLAIKLQAMNLPEEDKRFFSQLIPGYAVALKNMLRENENYQDLDPVLDLKKERHLPNQVASRLFQRVHDRHMEGQLSQTQLWILNEDIKMLTDLCGACERIKNTPIPYTYQCFY